MSAVGLRAPSESGELERRTGPRTTVESSTATRKQSGERGGELAWGIAAVRQKRARYKCP